MFVRDNLTKPVVRVSVEPRDAVRRAERISSISNDGSKVVFSAEATNLHGGDTDGLRDVFYRDRDTDHDGIFDEAGGVLPVLRSSLTTPGSRERDQRKATVIGNGIGVVFEATGAVGPVMPYGLMDVARPN